jgi:Zn(2)-Cys(6) binuclear cluster domain-containing protein
MEHQQQQQQQQQQHSTASGRARGPAACERCRDRKTKCDFQRPVCGYCSKRQVSCVYPEDAAKWVASLSLGFGFMADDL